MSIGSALFGGDSKPGDSIETQPLNFTSKAGISGIFVAVAGGVAAVLQVATAWKLTDTRLLGAFGLIAAGVLAMAIASAGDALARAYSSAWVVSQKEVPNADGSKTIVAAHPAVVDMKPVTVPPSNGSLHLHPGEQVMLHPGDHVVIDVDKA